MFCSQCGTQLPDGSMFCHVCGAKQIEPNANLQSVQKEQQEQQVAEKENTVKTDHKGLIICVSIVATILACIAIVIFVLNPFKKINKDKEADTAAVSLTDSSGGKKTDTTEIATTTTQTLSTEAVEKTTEASTTQNAGVDNGSLFDDEVVTAQEFTNLPLLFIQKGCDQAGVHYLLGEPHHTEIENSGNLYEFFEYEYSGIDGTIYVSYFSEDNTVAFGLWTNININDATIDARIMHDDVHSGRFNDDFSKLEESIMTSTGAEQKYFDEDESGFISIRYENQDNGDSIWIYYNKNIGKIEIGLLYFD